MAGGKRRFAVMTAEDIDQKLKASVLKNTQKYTEKNTSSSCKFGIVGPKIGMKTEWTKSHNNCGRYCIVV